jgi:THO complex subunit 2
LFVNLHDTVIFTCTNREAENYGRFLREILGELARWYGDRSIYEKEAIGPSTPGFLKKWNINPSEAIYLQYEEFKSVMLKWHKYMTTGFRSCLESRDYMHVRNALAVLEKIITHYPQVDLHGSILEEKVDLIAGKSETRGDLQIRAQGYLALLRKSSKTLVTAAKFSTQNKPASSPGYPAGPKRPSTPQNLSSETSALNTSIDRQPERVRSALNPTAPSFKPPDNTYR